MREIKFRTWNEATKSYSYHDSPNWDDEYGVLVFDGNLDGPFDVLEQYTGLKDCHGKEIYEGDILKCKTQNPSAKDKVICCDVYFCVGTASCEYKVKLGKWTKGLSSNRIYNWKAEIIGNIHENTELLK